MNINSMANMHNQMAFEARIKMKKPNLETITKVALGSTALAAGAATMAEGVVSIAAESGAPQAGDPSAVTQMPLHNSMQSIPKDVMNFHKEILTSADGHYDAAGYVEGLPVQSTIFPTACTASGYAPSVLASKAVENTEIGNAIHDTALRSSNRSEVTSLRSADKTNAFSENKYRVLSVLGSSLISAGTPTIFSIKDLPTISGSGLTATGSSMIGKIAYDANEIANSNNKKLPS